jgi:predicted phosphoribosyltransferase
MKLAWEKPYFKDREEAARLLAGRLAEYRGEDPLVLAVPRGAVPMGRVLADELQGDLDVVLAHKIGAPDNPEFAVGAVGEGGEVLLADYARSLGYSEEGLEKEIRRQREALRKKRELYSSVRPAVPVEGRIVILVDDGIATGSTMIAAIQELRHRAPRRVVVAAACAPPEVVEKLHRAADEVVVLAAEADFGAVGEFFQDFRQVSDEEVLAALKGSVRGKKP